MSQKKRKPNEFTIGYKAMVTDYLLYEDCCDYHLKLILAAFVNKKLSHLANKKVSQL